MLLFGIFWGIKHFTVKIKVCDPIFYLFILKLTVYCSLQWKIKDLAHTVFFTTKLLMIITPKIQHFAPFYPKIPIKKLSTNPHKFVSHPWPHPYHILRPVRNSLGFIALSIWGNMESKQFNFFYQYHYQNLWGQMSKIIFD